MKTTPCKRQNKANAPVLIVAAAEFEAAPTRDSLESLGIASEFFACGIGPINAAKSVNELKRLACNREVIFLGTCGTFSNSFSTIEVVNAASARWLPAGVRLGFAEVIEGIYPKVDFPSTLRGVEGTSKPNMRRMTSLRRVHMLCSSAISSTPGLPTGWNREDYCENLELYSLAGDIIDVCSTFDSFFAITNEISRDSRRQWKNNFTRAAELTANAISASLRHKVLK